MTEGSAALPTDNEIASALLELSQTRQFSAGTKTTLKLAAERLQNSRPVYEHVVRGSSYEVFFEEADVQAAAPICEGDKVTVYLALADGRPFIRPADEFLQRFIRTA